MHSHEGGTPGVKSQGGNHALRATLVTVCVLAGVMVGLWFWMYGSSGRETVDFTDTVDVAAPAEDDRTVLRVAIAAMISPEETRRYYYEMVEHVGDRLGMRTVFLQRRTYAEVNALVEKKEVDLAFVCSGPYVDGHDSFGMEIVAVPVVGDEKVYYSYILAGKDSPINSFKDLKGRRFAFTDPDSNTGCLVPIYMLSKMGETPESFFSETFFTHSHDNSILAVSTGQADGAAVDSLIYDFLRSKDPGITEATRVVDRSSSYGIPPVVVHPAIDPALKDRIRHALFDLDKDEEGRALLDRLQIQRFEPGHDSDYDEIRTMKRWLQDKEVTFP